MGMHPMNAPVTPINNKWTSSNKHPAFVSRCQKSLSLKMKYPAEVFFTGVFIIDHNSIAWKTERFNMIS